MNTKILKQLFEISPYQDFPYQDYPEDLQGWGSSVPIFSKLINELKPSVIIEVGTWKGASAINMVEILKVNNLQSTVFCIDTWLGGYEHVSTLPRKYGYPTLFYQFLANVLHKNAQDFIVPIPMTSNIAWHWLCQHNIKADLIYIDGSHEEEDVYQDLCHYWQLLRPNGVLLADDYRDQNFPGVLCAIHRFAKENNLKIASQGNKAYFTKPLSTENLVATLSKQVAELELKLNPDIDLSYFQ